VSPIQVAAWITSSGCLFTLTKDGAPLAGAQVLVNGQAVPEKSPGSYQQLSLTPIGPGGQVTVEVRSGDQVVSGVGNAPQIPTVTAPRDGDVVTPGTPLHIAWTFDGPADWFLPMLDYDASGGGHGVALNGGTRRDVDMDISFMPADAKNVRLTVASWRDIVTFTSPADPASVVHLIQESARVSLRTPSPEPPPPIPETTFRIDGITYKVIRGCDGSAENAEYHFRTRVSLPTEDIDLHETTGYPGKDSNPFLDALSLGQGQTATFPLFFATPLPVSPAPVVRVWFRATEWDTLGSNIWVRDPTMNDRALYIEHRYISGSWTNLGPQTITLGDVGSCQVSMSYSASNPVK
jgi:hypothetical protein